jgi:NAD(P)-dependent dehydrogenase (short-subunit alcohol dehydrogenase family)
MAMNLSGKTAFVTGAGSGIGTGIVQALAEKGMRVVLADIDFDLAKSEAAAIGADALALHLDVTSLDSWAEAKAAAEAHFGPVDVLCNNAGIATPRTLLDEVPPELFARVLAVNVTGVYNGVHSFVPDMRARGQGHVVNTSSVNGLLAHGRFGAYSASKFAVTGLSDALRQELEPYGVGVSVLYPGLTRSRMSMSPDVGAQLDEIAREALESRMMEPIWLGRAVARAIENNELHIVSHPAHKDEIEKRYAALMAAHGEPAQPGYVW